MPRQNIDYSNTVIYKIVCNDENVDYIYVGSTTNFTKRKYAHKSHCNNINDKEYNQKKYVQIRENGGWESFRMIEVEKYPCNDKREAEKREEEVRLELKANMNSIRCYITEEEKKDHQKTYYKEYNKVNKIKMDGYRKHYKDINKEYFKKYYEANKEKLFEKAKVYRAANEDKIKQYNEANKETFHCDCGSISRIGNKTHHFKTFKHQNYLKTKI